MIPVQRPQLGEEELKAVAAIFSSRWLGLGSATKEFEDRLKDMLGVRHVLAVNTGTSALHLALEALQLKPGDEVIVPSLTFVASVQAILMAGLRPVFCDVSVETLELDLESVQRVVSPRSRVIMPVHYSGLACEMDEILTYAKDRQLSVVEDAAHAFGSSYKGRKVGTFGDLTCFSFDPIKNITCGEGGAVTTDRDDLAKVMIPKRILGIDNDTWNRYRNERNWSVRGRDLGVPVPHAQHQRGDWAGAVGEDGTFQAAQSYHCPRIRRRLHGNRGFASRPAQSR